MLQTAPQLVNQPFQPAPYPVYYIYPVNYVYTPIISNQPFHRNSGCISPAEMKLNQTFRALWEQHVAWTRMLIISIAEDLADEEFVTARLLRNPSDMAAVFKTFYGEKVAAQFENLFREHLVLAAQLVKAAKAGNEKAAAELEKKWYMNADQIAAFLSSINPNWSKEALTKMLHEHLRMTKDEAVYRLTKQYEKDIETYDQIEKQALEMADAFAKGIQMQFPNAFK